MNPVLTEIYSTVAPSLPYIVVAYALVWLVLLAWVAIQFTKQKKLSAQLSILEEELEERKVREQRD